MLGPQEHTQHHINQCSDDNCPSTIGTCKNTRRAEGGDFYSASNSGVSIHFKADSGLQIDSGFNKYGKTIVTYKVSCSSPRPFTHACSTVQNGWLSLLALMTVSACGTPRENYWNTRLFFFCLFVCLIKKSILQSSASACMRIMK